MARLTWDQLRLPDFGDAIRGQAIAAGQFDRAMQGLNQGLQNFQQARADSAESILQQRMAQFGNDPAAFQKAIQSGALTQGLTALGPKAGQEMQAFLDRVNQRADAQTARDRSQHTWERQVGAEGVIDTNLPIQQQAQALAAQGRMKDAMQLLQTQGQSGFGQAPDLAGTAKLGFAFNTDRRGDESLAIQREEANTRRQKMLNDAAKAKGDAASSSRVSQLILDSWRTSSNQDDAIATFEAESKRQGFTPTETMAGIQELKKFSKGMLDDSASSGSSGGSFRSGGSGSGRGKASAAIADSVGGPLSPDRRSGDIGMSNIVAPTQGPTGDVLRDEASHLATSAAYASTGMPRLYPELHGAGSNVNDIINHYTQKGEVWAGLNTQDIAKQFQVLGAYARKHDIKASPADLAIAFDEGLTKGPTGWWSSLGTLDTNIRGTAKGDEGALLGDNAARNALAQLKDGTYDSVVMQTQTAQAGAQALNELNQGIATTKNRIAALEAKGRAFGDSHYAHQISVENEKLQNLEDAQRGVLEAAEKQRLREAAGAKAKREAENKAKGNVTKALEQAVYIPQVWDLPGMGHLKPKQ